MKEIPFSQKAIALNTYKGDKKYNLGVVGEIRKEQITQLDESINKHLEVIDSLRSKFVIDLNDVKVAYEDYHWKDGEIIEIENIDEIILDEEFDIFKGNLFVWKYYKLSNKIYLKFEFHHILMDWQSLNYLIESIETYMTSGELTIKDGNQKIKENPYTAIKEKDFTSVYTKPFNFKGALANEATSITLNYNLEKLASQYASQSVIIFSFIFALSLVNEKSNSVFFGIIVNNKKNRNISMSAFTLPIRYTFNFELTVKEELERFENNYISTITSFLNEQALYSPYLESILVYNDSSDEIESITNFRKIKNKTPIYPLVIEYFSNISKFNFIGEENATKLFIHHFQKTVSDFDKNVQLQKVKNIIKYEEIIYNDDISFELENKQDVLIDHKGSFSGAQVNMLTSRIANKIIQSTTKNYVAICTPKNANLVLLLLGAFKSGKTVVILDENAPQMRKKIIADDLKFELTLNESFLEDISKFVPLNNIRYNENLFICYTSGTTGIPKGVRLRASSILNMVTDSVITSNFNTATKIISIASVNFDMFYSEILLPLLNGGSVYVCSEEESMMPQTIKEIIQTHQINNMYITPSRFDLFVDLGWLDIFANFQALNFGGEAFSPKVLNNLKYLKNSKINNLYGPTEATFYCLKKEIKGGEITLGLPVLNTEILILKDGEVCKTLEPGELVVFGANVALNYTDPNNDKFTTYNGRKCYHTGDIGYKNAEGEILLVGRVDNQIKINGQRLNIEDLDNICRKYQGVKEAFVLYENKVINCYFLPDENFEYENYLTYLQENIRSFAVPKKFHTFDYVSFTTNGKIDKKKIAENSKIYDLEKEITQENISHNLEVEKDLLEVLENVFGRKISLNDSFYDAGGDSLFAIMLISKLSKLGYNISINDIMQSKDFNALITLLGNSKSNTEAQGNISNNNSLKTPQINFLKNYNEDYKTFFMAYLIKINKTVKDNLEVFYQYIMKKYPVLGIKVNNQAEHYGVQDFGKYTSLEDECLNKDVINAYDSSNGSLGIITFDINNENYSLLFCHHFLVDAVSFNILLDELNHFKPDQINEELVYDGFNQNEFTKNDYTKLYAEQCWYWKKITENNIPVYPETKTLSKKLELSINETEYEEQLLNACFLKAVMSVLKTEQVVEIKEFHGRDLDVYTTNVVNKIGWYTARVPLKVENGSIHDIHNQIETQEIIAKGAELSFDILNYSEFSQEIFENGFQVGFNNLGQLDKTTTQIIEINPFKAIRNINFNTQISMNYYLINKKLYIYFESNILSENLLERLIEVFTFYLEGGNHEI